jgi:hypothetical protein
LLDCSGRPIQLAKGDRRRDLSLDFVYGLFSRVPEAREIFWNVFNNCRKTNPAALRHILGLMALYIDLGPFSRFVVREIDRRIETIDRALPAIVTGTSSSASPAA